MVVSPRCSWGQLLSLKNCFFPPFKVPRYITVTDFPSGGYLPVEIVGYLLTLAGEMVVYQEIWLLLLSSSHALPGALTVQFHIPVNVVVGILGDTAIQDFVTHAVAGCKEADGLPNIDWTGVTNQMLHGVPIDCRGKFRKLEDVEQGDEDEDGEEVAEHEAEPLAQKPKPKKTGAKRKQDEESSSSKRATPGKATSTGAQQSATGGERSNSEGAAGDPADTVKPKRLGFTNWTARINRAVAAKK